ncbi:MAG: cation diffusion facilitator family transporter [Acidobacteriota bacterium]
MKKREKLGYLEGFVSILLNILLFVLKYWAGIVSGSIALIADAWHTLSDSISSLILMAGVKLSSRKPDKKHVFGHGRWEQISAIFIGFLLAVVAYEFLKESIEKYFSGESADFGMIALVVTIISILLKEGLAQFAFRLWRITGNIALKADGWHHRTDALSSLIVLAGILLKDLFWWIDSVLGILISFMIFYTVYEIVKEAIGNLMGESPGEDLISEIKTIIAENSEAHLVPHHFHIHNYGKHSELTFHIKIDGNINIAAGHEIATKIEKAIKRKMGIEATIHMEPV